MSAGFFTHRVMYPIFDDNIYRYVEKNGVRAAKLMKRMDLIS
ncbi:hypothetical protein LTSEGIV_2387 [Salmonella enterica subsp. enterica serovar Give str. S5-487]|nr:hypothetical protein LTSEGIV_2387 [Salmonella enterica subsp. enterica serovar Give str. S5-487]